MKLDIQKWNQERLATEKNIKELKNAIRSSDGGTWEQYRNLKTFKASATAMYAVRAALRNKDHCPSMDKEAGLLLLPGWALPDVKEAA